MENGLVFFPIRGIFSSMKAFAWENFRVRVSAAEHLNGEDFPSHDHPFYELVFVCEGQADHCPEREQYPIHAGDIFLIPPGFSHSYKNARIKIYNILISKEFQSKIPPDLLLFPNYQLLFRSAGVPFPQRLLTLEDAFFPEMISILEEMVQEENLPQTPSFSAGYSSFLRMLVLICRHAHPWNSRKQTPAYRIAAFMTELEKRYAENWTLESMAEENKMSVSLFRQQFRAMTGHAPVDYLLRIRIRKACGMLDVPMVRISEVAEACGFPDSNYFSRIFRKMNGVSPREYRDRLKNRPFSDAGIPSFLES